MSRRIIVLALSGLCCLTSEGWSQVAWDTPMLTPPVPRPGFGAYISEPHRGDLAVLITWRPVGARPNLGLRFGLADGPGPDDVSGFAGADFTGLLHRSSRDFPMDVAWLSGVGIGFGDWVMLSVPLGLTLGHTFRGEGVLFTPYFGPRVTMDGHFGRHAPRDDLDLGLAVDLGVDVTFLPRVTVRFGATFGDREALAIGMVF